MTSDQRITRLCLLVSSLFLAVQNSGCSSDGASVGPAVTANGHSVPTTHSCTAPKDCTKFSAPPCMMWNGCEERVCVLTLATGLGCVPDEVVACTTTQSNPGIAICSNDCSFDSMCTACGVAQSPCCPGPMGGTCTAPGTTCVLTGYPTGTCQ